MQDSKSSKMNEVAIRKYVDSRNKNKSYDLFHDLNKYGKQNNEQFYELSYRTFVGKPSLIRNYIFGVHIKKVGSFTGEIHYDN